VKKLIQELTSCGAVAGVPGPFAEVTRPGGLKPWKKRKKRKQKRLDGKKSR